MKSLLILSGLVLTVWAQTDIFGWIQGYNLLPGKYIYIYYEILPLYVYDSLRVSLKSLFNKGFLACTNVKCAFCERIIY